MKVIQEITQWDVEYTVPNHVYFVNDSQDKMFAYVALGSAQVQKFRTPIKFSASRRKFQEIENVWGFVIKQETESAGKQYQVPGSKGAVYTVTNDCGTWTCTCPASKWQKSECKHIIQLKTTE